LGYDLLELPSFILGTFGSLLYFQAKTSRAVFDRSRGFNVAFICPFDQAIRFTHSVRCVTVNRNFRNQELAEKRDPILGGKMHALEAKFMSKDNATLPDSLVDRIREAAQSGLTDIDLEPILEDAPEGSPGTLTAKDVTALELHGYEVTTKFLKNDPRTYCINISWRFAS
jgi:hypothetical protein